MSILLFTIGRINNAALKKRFLRLFLKHATQKEIERWADMFIGRLLKRGMRRRAFARLQWHQHRGTC